MYEPIRTKSVHTPADHADDFPHRSREEELDIQLAGHLAALLAVTDELGLGEAGDRIAEQVARLRGAPPASSMRFPGSMDIRRDSPHAMPDGTTSCQSPRTTVRRAE
ncbi:SCO4983 family protein, partial [Streptomyces sp. 900116325]